MEGGENRELPKKRQKRKGRENQPADRRGEIGRDFAEE